MTGNDQRSIKESYSVCVRDDEFDFSHSKIYDAEEESN